MSNSSLSENQKWVTILFYETDNPLKLQSYQSFLPVAVSGRVVIPKAFKERRSVIAVLEGKCKVLNALGDRVQTFEDVQQPAQEDEELRY